VVEKISLPTDTCTFGGDLLKVSHHGPHVFIPGERRQSMQMIRHEHQQMHIPTSGALAEIHRLKQL
jgi:hypothetical protein